MRNGSEFRRPLLGAANFPAGTDYDDWPLEPIQLVDGVPFLIVLGYDVGGSPEAGVSYLDYCIKNCDWNSTPYNRTAEKAKALEKLLSPEKAKGRLLQAEREFFSAQIK